jgi:hypothetical protein
MGRKRLVSFNFGETLDFQTLGGFQESWQIILRNIHFASVHELQNRLEMVEGYVFEDYYGMFARIVLQ